MTELSNCMSLSAHRRHLSATRALCMLARAEQTAQPHGHRSGSSVDAASDAASVFMRCRRCCGRHRSTSGLLLCTICMHYVHHMQEGADDVSGLLIAALTASAHAIGRGSEGACWLYVRCSALAADREPMAQPAASQLLWS